MVMAASVENKPVNRRSGYRPPQDVFVTSLGTIIAGARVIPEDQQSRLGFTASDATGLRIWAAGDASLVQKKCVAIVGTRSITDEGRSRARRLAKELVANGVVVVSGLALGVDAEAMNAAMASGGRVIGVIGTPIDKAYPAENAKLQQDVYTKHLLVSQFAPGSQTYKGNFPTRNKLMAALSDATVIIEASDTSGTLHQAAECLRLRRHLFIAKSIIGKVSWPDRFLGKQNVHLLSETADVIARL